MWKMEQSLKPKLSGSRLSRSRSNFHCPVGLSPGYHMPSYMWFSWTFRKKIHSKKWLFQNWSNFFYFNEDPLSWPKESNENLPTSERSGIKQVVHFNEGIDCSAEHSYQVWTKSVVDSGDQTQDSGRKRIPIVCWTEGPNDQILLP